MHIFIQERIPATERVGMTASSPPSAPPPPVAPPPLLSSGTSGPHLPTISAPTPASLFQRYLDSCAAQSVSHLSGVCLHSDWYGSTLSASQRDLLATSPPSHTEYRLYKSCIDLVQRHSCVRCWLQQHTCICARLPPLSTPLTIRLVVSMHHIEVSKASNTAKLLLTALDGRLDPRVHFPADSPLSEPLLSPLADSSSAVSSSSTPPPLLLIAGVAAHDAQLQSICAEDPTGARTLVLFPTPDSIDLHSWLAARGFPSPPPLSASPSPSAPNPRPPLTLIVVDGTYNQAASLVRAIPPHILRVRLPPHPTPALTAYHTALHRRLSTLPSPGPDPHRRGKQWTPAAGSLFTALRRQPQADRLSTVEAVAVALEAVEGRLRTEWLDGLQMLVDALRLQAGLYQMYGSFSEGEVDGMREMRNGMYTMEVQRAAAVKREREGKRGVGEICRAFNGRGCSRLECRYPHRCSNCDGPHPAPACDEYSEETGQG